MTCRRSVPASGAGRDPRPSALAIFVHALRAMKRALLALGLAACGSSDSEVLEPRPLTFERWSPAQQSSYDVFVAARGETIVMATRISRDGGATWAALDPRLGTPARIALDDGGLALYAPGVGLARYDLAAGALTPIAAPGFAADRTWRRDPAGKLIVFDPVGNAIAIQAAAGWATAALPAPAATECCAYVTDVESNGQVMLSVSGWGVHRSRDGGATWQLAAAPQAGAGRDLLVLGDGRFALVGGATSYAFTADGVAAGTLPGLVLGDDEAQVCDDGSIVARGAVTRDLGATWLPLASAGDLDVVIERASCGAGSYWVLMRSDAWGYRLLRYAAPGAPGVAIGGWDAAGPQAWASAGPSIVRTDDGTFLAGGLAWREGDAAWTLREMPARTWSSGGVLFGVGASGAYTSRDAGVTWTQLAALPATDPDAFAAADGALYVGQFGGTSANGVDRWRADVWRSTDGVTWTSAYAGDAARRTGGDITGSAHRFVGITADGTWVATDAISHDAGASWESTQAVGDRSMAHLLADGALVMQPADASGSVWRVYADGGAGDLLATHAIAADGSPVLAADLRSVAFDAAGYAYVARGTPHVQIWRSTTPLERPGAPR